MNDLNSAETLPMNEKWYAGSHGRFLLFNVVFVVAFFGPLRDLFVTNWNSPYLTYIPIVPFISAYLFYQDRESIFGRNASPWFAGLALMGLGIALYLAGRGIETVLDRSEQEALATMAMVLMWIGGFGLCYGMEAFRSAISPLLFLFFMVPVPNGLLDGIIVLLQTGSAEVSYWLLKMSGMPIAREEFVFYLPTINIEVAKQCSGIRSALSLVITGALAAVLFLKTGWARSILILTTLPIAIVKNGIRIGILSLLGVYVDKGFITESALHHSGGFAFFLIALVLLGGVIGGLRKMEGGPVGAKRNSGEGIIKTSGVD